MHAPMVLERFLTVTSKQSLQWNLDYPIHFQSEEFVYVPRLSFSACIDILCR